MAGSCQSSLRWGKPSGGGWNRRFKKIYEKKNCHAGCRRPRCGPTDRLGGELCAAGICRTVMGACGPPVQVPWQRDRGRLIRSCVCHAMAKGAWLSLPWGQLMFAAWLWPILAVMLLPFAVIVAALELLCRSVKRRIGKGPVYGAVREGGLVSTFLGFRIPISFFRHVVILARSGEASWPSDPRALIVHCNDLETLLVGVMARRAYGCKLVYDCHEFLPHAWPDATRWNRWLLGRYEGWLIRFADSVFTVSPLLAGEIMKAYRGIEVQSVPNAEPLDDDEIDRDSITVQQSHERKPLQFLLPGEFLSGSRHRRTDRRMAGDRPRRGGAAAARVSPRAQDKLRSPGGIAGAERRERLLPAAGGENCLIATAAEADVGVIPYMPTTINFRYCSEQAFGIHGGGLACDGRQYGLCRPDHHRIRRRIVLRSGRSGVDRNRGPATGAGRATAATMPAKRRTLRARDVSLAGSEQTSLRSISAPGRP